MYGITGCDIEATAAFETEQCVCDISGKVLLRQ
jgi:hypothetical protein